MKNILAVLLLLISCCSNDSKSTKNDILNSEKINYGKILHVQFNPGSAFGFRGSRTIVNTKTKNLVLWQLHYDILIGNDILVTKDKYLYEGDRWSERKYAMINDSIYPMDNLRKSRNNAISKF